ncbi:MAG TPA: hypothetical protein PK867_28465 [Pirellulales bacterium]|nr:hypothetical protein [Pirellulales bacterium]
MHSLALVLWVALLGQEEAPAKGPGIKPATQAAGSTDSSAKSKLLELYLREAQDFDISRHGDQREKLALRKEPVYVWTNPLVANGQYGAVYVWTWQGRPEVVASIFVYNFAGPGQLGLMHADLRGEGHNPDYTYQVYRDRATICAG